MATFDTVDAHVHLIGDPRRYPLQPTALAGDTWYRAKPVDAATFTAQMDAAGVGRAVLVQPVGAYGSDNSYAVDAAAAAPDRFAAVCKVDPAAPAPAETLSRWVERGARGVRLFAVRDPHEQSVDAPPYLPLWQEADRLGITVVVTLWSRQLPGLVQMLKRFSGLRVALDHCAFPRFDGPAPSDDLSSLLALAEHPGLSLKVTTHVIDAYEAAGRPAHELLSQLVREFGAARLVWGSDYSQTHDRDYRALVDLGRTACAALDEPARTEVLRLAAERLWWPGD